MENKMKIYVRERLKVGNGVHQPRFKVVAVTGGELQVLAGHLRKTELEQIARDAGAEIVYLEAVPAEERQRGGSELS